MLQIPSDTATQITQVYNRAIFIHFGTDMANIFFIADAGDYDLMLNYQIIENSLFLY